jgi:phage terminase large subunit-like protein
MSGGEVSIATSPQESHTIIHIDIETGEQQVRQVSLHSPDPPNVPDGGWRAWLIVVGSSLTLFSSFGIVSALSVEERSLLRGKALSNH